MYVPSHFAMTEDDVRELLARHGAGDLVTFSTEAGLVATMLPFVHEPSADGWGSLHGHVARVNAQWKHQVVGEALVILRGPDAYVSPGWYASKQEHGRVVPTWNYVSAHVYGELVVHDDAEYTRRVVEALTAEHEAGSAHPWSVDDAPAEYIEGQLRAVVGVELRITRVEAKAKASQNRPPADVDGVVDGLRGHGDIAMADVVQRHAAPRTP